MRVGGCEGGRGSEDESGYNSRRYTVLYEATYKIYSLHSQNLRAIIIIIHTYILYQTNHTYLQNGKIL